VRGRGLMLALELASAEVTGEAMQGCFQRGMLVLPTGTRALRFSPGLTLSQGEIEVALEILEEAARPLARLLS
jgi:acetylornithine/succinyldiaminopimelate/putrescine aminotransferase